MRWDRIRFFFSEMKQNQILFSWNETELEIFSWDEMKQKTEAVLMRWNQVFMRQNISSWFFSQSMQAILSETCNSLTVRLYRDELESLIVLRSLIDQSFFSVLIIANSSLSLLFWHWIFVIIHSKNFLITLSSLSFSVIELELKAALSKTADWEIANQKTANWETVELIWAESWYKMN